MSDRSDELLRQRDLLREHLAWIEREIAAERQAPAEPLATGPAGPAPRSPADARDAEAILAEYRTPEASISRQTKLGCILYFLVAVGAVVAAVLAFYYFTRSGRAR